MGLMAILVHIAMLTSPPDPIAGTASWYDYMPRQAAAGPALREALGKDWRGQIVTVCVSRETSSACAKVRLTDWCQCHRGTNRERIIDLDRRTFAVLGVPPSRGIAKVRVHL
jgi:rare lipoprotein A (peptidoglycan hydrolase)